MDIVECSKIIYEETMLPDGFLWKSREDQIDVDKFKRLVNSIIGLTKLTSNDKVIDKLVVACLFSAPIELENTVSHYEIYDKDLGKHVAQMAEELNDVIQVLLWSGLEEYYENAVNGSDSID